MGLPAAVLLAILFARGSSALKICDAPCECTQSVVDCTPAGDVLERSDSPSRTTPTVMTLKLNDGGPEELAIPETGGEALFEGFDNLESLTIDCEGTSKLKRVGPIVRQNLRGEGAATESPLKELTIKNCPGLSDSRSYLATRYAISMTGTIATYAAQAAPPCRAARRAVHS